MMKIIKFEVGKIYQYGWRSSVAKKHIYSDIDLTKYIHRFDKNDAFIVLDILYDGIPVMHPDDMFLKILTTDGFIGYATFTGSSWEKIK